jgi:hypothetical protein
MFTRHVSKTSTALAVSGFFVSLGVVLAPAVSAMPVDHYCDKLVQAVNIYHNAMNSVSSTSDAFWDYSRLAYRAEQDAIAEGCIPN